MPATHLTIRLLCAYGVSALLACAGGRAAEVTPGFAAAGSPAPPPVPRAGASGATAGTGALPAAGTGHVAGGSAADDAGPPDAPEIDLTGTWISASDSTGHITAPIVGSNAAAIHVTLKLELTRAAGQLNARFQVCRLGATTTPNPEALKVKFNPAVVETLVATATAPAVPVEVGGPLDLPDVTFRTGVDLGGRSVDSDADMHPGVSLPGTVSNITITLYASLVIAVSFDAATLTTKDTISGTIGFDAQGEVFGSDNVISTGMLGVAPDSKVIPFEARRAPDGLKCADVHAAP